MSFLKQLESHQKEISQLATPPMQVNKKRASLNYANKKLNDIANARIAPTKANIDPLSLPAIL